MKKSSMKKRRPRSRPRKSPVAAYDAPEVNGEEHAITLEQFAASIALLSLSIYNEVPKRYHALIAESLQEQIAQRPQTSQGGTHDCDLES